VFQQLKKVKQTTKWDWFIPTVNIRNFMFKAKNILLLSLVIVFSIVTILSLIPPKLGMPRIPTNDKVGHFLAYATLSVNVCLLFDSWKKEVYIALLSIVLYGVLIEFLQGFVDRETSFYDFLANTIGVAVGASIVRLFRRPITQFLVKINVISLHEK
jgi:VanZ family protein